MPASRYWTTREVSIIRQHYPAGGAEACRELLPGRTLGAIYQQALRLQLKVATLAPRKRRKWESNDWIDTQIRTTYQRPMERGDVQRLADRVGRSRWWVSKRAAKLGVARPLRDPPWTEAEEELLARHVHKDPVTISRIFSRHGYSRTRSAITVKRKRLHLRPADNGYHTAGQVAALMGVDATTVSRWIRQGLLQAGRRGTQRTESQGGDHWWVNERDLRAFVAANPALVDVRKVDGVWFIELLTGRAA